MSQPNVYTVHDIFPSIQGEGLRSGTKAIFVRFAGCNLWNGRPLDRGRGEGACSRYCDTNFAQGRALTAEEIINTAEAAWKTEGEKWVVLSGGEPVLQLDTELIEALHGDDWKIAVETNGTLDPLVSSGKEGGTTPLLEMVDWVTVSPKLGVPTKLLRGEELKVVLPGAMPPDPGWTEEALLALARNGKWKHAMFVQPQDPVDPKKVESSFLHGMGDSVELAGIFKLHLQRCVSWVAEHPEWRLGSQAHKLWGLP